jgi:hypothetical protein
LGAGLRAAEGGGGVGCVVAGDVSDEASAEAAGDTAPSLADVTESAASAAWVSAVFGAAGAAVSQLH